MAVPIDLLPPILDDLLTRGQVNRPPRPWLGVFSAENDGDVVVMSVADDGPAAKAGLQRGDIISDVRDGEVDGLADFYRKLWSSGPAGAEVPMRIVRDGRDTWLRIKSADRNSFLRRPHLQLGAAPPELEQRSIRAARRIALGIATVAIRRSTAPACRADVVVLLARRVGADHLEIGEALIRRCPVPAGSTSSRPRNLAAAARRRRRAAGSLAARHAEHFVGVRMIVVEVVDAVVPDAASSHCREQRRNRRPRTAARRDRAAPAAAVGHRSAGL